MADWALRCYKCGCELEPTAYELVEKIAKCVIRCRCCGQKNWFEEDYLRDFVSR